ncbi:MAG TPA: hypothetical protein VFY03_01670 [Woeseiaceae bacterium]|nr:hypothetical protein [Woeseiaceae bacterium]
MKLLVGIVILAAVGYFGSKAWLHNEVRGSVDRAVTMVSPYMDVEYEGISSTLTGELTVDGVIATVSGFRDPIRIDRIGIDTPSFFSLLRLGDLPSGFGSGGEAPEEIGFLVEGLRIGTRSDLFLKMHEFRVAAQGAADEALPAAQCVGKYGFSPGALEALGYDEQVLSASFRFRNAATHYVIAVDAGIEDMWRMSMDIDLDGDAAAEFAKGTAYRPALRSVAIEYTDRSLNGRVTKYCESLGLTAGQVLQAQLDALHYFGEANGITFDEYFIEPYKEFLGGKSTIIVSAQPDKPLPISQLGLYNPKDVPALLNLTASAL